MPEIDYPKIDKLIKIAHDHRFDEIGADAREQLVRMINADPNLEGYGPLANLVWLDMVWNNINRYPPLRKRNRFIQ